MIEGIDISNWQGNFDWGAASSWGLGFGIAKASEGFYTDAYWARNQTALLAPGPIVGGSYHFFHGDPNEADFYLSRHDPKCFDPGTPWIFSLDAEAGGTDVACNQFMAKVAARTGYNPWFYSYGGWIQARPGLDRNFPLWIAAPSSGKGSPPTYGWPFATAQQYGLTHGVDADVFLGDQATLLKLAGAGIGGDMPQSDDILRLLLFGEDPAYANAAGNPAGWTAPGGKGHLTRVAEVLLANQAAILSNLGVEKAEVDAMLAAIKTPPAVDIEALAVALAPHLPPSVDVKAVAQAVVNEIGVRVRPA